MIWRCLLQSFPARYRPDVTTVLLSLKLIQPGMLGDVVEGMLRLLPEQFHTLVRKEDVRRQLDILRERKLVCLYAGRRYMLTQPGADYVSAVEIKQKIDARRLYLLKETRRDTFQKRSGTRDGSLQQ